MEVSAPAWLQAGTSSWQFPADGSREPAGVQTGSAGSLSLEALAFLHWHSHSRVDKTVLGSHPREAGRAPSSDPSCPQRFGCLGTWSLLMHNTHSTLFVLIPHKCKPMVPECSEERWELFLSVSLQGEEVCLVH